MFMFYFIEVRLVTILATRSASILPKKLYQKKRKKISWPSPPQSSNWVRVAQSDRSDRNVKFFVGSRDIHSILRSR